MLQSAPGRKTGTNAAAASDPKRRRKLLLAMVILFATLVVVLIRDGQLWFYRGDAPARVEDATWVGPSASSTAAVPAPAAPATVMKKHVAAQAEPETTSSVPPVVATNRAPLPPLNVEVVSGSTPRTINLNKNSLTPSASNSASMAATPASAERLTAAAQRQSMPQNQPAAIEQTVIAEYPMLAEQTKVQGSVLMQALIRADGVIQDLRVISGPAILAGAARQAVMQYRFKPYLQNGQPVETSARITVNFAIRVIGPVTAQHHPSGTSNTNGF